MGVALRAVDGVDGAGGDAGGARGPGEAGAARGARAAAGPRQLARPPLPVPPRPPHARPRRLHLRQARTSFLLALMSFPVCATIFRPLAEVILLASLGLDAAKICLTAESRCSLTVVF